MSDRIILRTVLDRLRLPPRGQPDDLTALIVVCLAGVEQRTETEEFRLEQAYEWLEAVSQRMLQVRDMLKAERAIEPPNTPNCGACGAATAIQGTGFKCLNCGASTDSEGKVIKTE